RSSKRKSALPQRTPASKGESVADPNDQMTLESTARSKEPAMVNAVETPSAITLTGECESTQRTEARSHRRNDVPVKRGKARDTLKDSGLSEAGDSGHEKGGTQESLTVHSQL
ncbi:MAG: hypothetical protein ACTSW8_02950, partial [Candidatus Thorarchaeota archaeon]